MDIQTKNKLLEKIISFAEKAFSNCDDGKKYFTERAITDAGLFTKYRIGIFDGSLIKALPKSGKIINDLQELGIINNGKEYFAGHM